MSDDSLLNLDLARAVQETPYNRIPLVKRQLEAQAALYVVDEGFYFRYVDPHTGLEVSKGVSEQAVRSALSSVPVDSGWLPPGAVRWGNSTPRLRSGQVSGDYCCLFQPAQRMLLHFENAPIFKSLPDYHPRRKTVSLDVPMPSLLFIGVGEAYYAFAAKASHFKPNLPLFAPPLPNLDEEMRICFGANRLPAVERGGFAEAWRAFCDAPFSDHHVQGRSHRHPKDVRLALLDALKRKRGAYPLDDLIEIKGVTPAAVFNHLVGRRAS